MRSARLDWHNQLRAKKGLDPYTYHSDLEKTAKKWADELVKIKQRTHKRSPQDGYYHYGNIKSWFAEQGVAFPVETGGRSAFSESIGYRAYQCRAGDCTQALLDASQKVFSMFEAEGEKGAHYKALVMPHFQQIGVGFQFEPERKQLYIVIHYAGELGAAQ